MNLYCIIKNNNTISKIDNITRLIETFKNMLRAFFTSPLFLFLLNLALNSNRLFVSLYQSVCKFINVYVLSLFQFVTYTSYKFQAHIFLIINFRFISHRPLPIMRLVYNVKMSFRIWTACYVWMWLNMSKQYKGWSDGNSWFSIFLYNIMFFCYLKRKFFSHFIFRIAKETEIKFHWAHHNAETML